MKTFRFENIWLLSHLQKRARKETFHPNKNLILGANHTGKSSLIRALFETLGASPQGEQDGWDGNTISVVEFSINDERYFALHERGNRAMFDAGGDIIMATGDYEDWNDCFARIAGFNLVFGDSEHSKLSADPSCFFLPFYINQDGSWGSGWNTFKRMQHYRSPQKDILEYFCGLRPPQYYELRAERDQKRSCLRELDKEHSSLNRARARLNQTIPLAGPKVDATDFNDEIVRLTKEVTLLNSRQEELREKAVREQELCASLDDQFKLAAKALAGYDEDMAFLEEKPDDKLVCPTCGAEHDDQFMDFLMYAEDARVLRDILIRLREDARVVGEKHCKTQMELRELETNYHRISEILDTRRGEIEFRQVIESLGAESAFSAFESEEKMLKGEINTVAGDIYVIEAQLNKYANRKHSREINECFRSAYSNARRRLYLDPIDITHHTLTSRPNLSGSGGPRSVLAYYAAIWQTCKLKSAAFSVPVIIDSPNQQAQDDINLSAVLRFIAKQLPNDIQLIVGLEKETDQGFDKTIKLDAPRELLQESRYDAIRVFVDPMAQMMFEALLKNDESSLFNG